MYKNTYIMRFNRVSVRFIFVYLTNRRPGGGIWSNTSAGKQGAVLLRLAGSCFLAALFVES